MLTQTGIYIRQSWKCALPVCHNGFVATHALGHMMYGYTLLVPVNQRVLNKLSKKHNLSGHKWSMTQKVLKSHKSKMSVIYIRNHENNVPSMFSLLHIYITLILLLWNLSTLLGSGFSETKGTFQNKFPLIQKNRLKKKLKKQPIIATHQK